MLSGLSAKSFSEEVLQPLHHFLQAMEKRENSLLSNPAFLSAVYLDKRYHVLLTEKQKEFSQIQLLGLWRKIQKVVRGRLVVG